MSKVDAFAILDFETSGLKSDLCAITETAVQVIHPNSFQEISRYTEYVKSDFHPNIIKGDNKPDNKPINPYKGTWYFEGALNVTGLTIEFLKKNGKDYTEVAQRMAEEFSKGKISSNKFIKPVIVGHNIVFDINFLQVLFKLAKIDLSKL